MMLNNLSPANQRKLTRLAAIQAQLLQQGLMRGFYGKLIFEAKIEDGTIQDICRRLEQFDK
jgi:hypothetical protein